MAETVGRSVDKRLVYLGLMLLTLAYPLVALTLIVRTQNDYDDEGRRITPPLPQVTCPIEGAEGDIDCVASPLAYANIDTIIGVFMVNEVVMHFTYVLYTKLWATAGIVFGFWREFLSIVAFLGPELTLNSFVYFLQTTPFMRRLLPSLKTQHMPLLLGFLIGAMLSTCYGLGTAQTTDQFRRAVTLAGPGTMFLFVDWFSRSVFVPLFELMQNTFTQLKVNTFLLAIFELVLTNLYGSLFLPATQKLCVVLARFFYNVSYGVDSKVSLYDYVNLKSMQTGLDPSDPLSKRTTLVSPKDIGTYEPEVCRSSISSLTRRKRFTGRSAGGDTLSCIHSDVSQPTDASVPQGECPQQTTAVRSPYTIVAVESTYQNNASGAKRVSQLPGTQTRKDKADEGRRGTAAESKQGGATVNNQGLVGSPQRGTHRNDNLEGHGKGGKQNTGRTGSNEAMRRERLHQRGRDAVDDDSLPLPEQPSGPAETRGADGGRKRSAGPHNAQRLCSVTESNGPVCAVDVEVNPEPDCTLRPSVQHFSSAPDWSETEAEKLQSEEAYANNENACFSSDPDAHDGAQRQDAHDWLTDNQPGQIQERSVTLAADAGDDPQEDGNNPNIPSAVMGASGEPEPLESVCPSPAAPSHCDGFARNGLAPKNDETSFRSAESPVKMQQEKADLTDKNRIALKESDLEQKRRFSGASRASSSQGATLKEPREIGGIVGSAESLSCNSSQTPNRVAPMVTDGHQYLSVEDAGVRGEAPRQKEDCQRQISSTPRLLTPQRSNETPGATTGASSEHVEEGRSRRARGKRTSQVEVGNVREEGRGSVDEHPRGAPGKRQSQTETYLGGGGERHNAGEQASTAHRERRSQLDAEGGGVLDDEHAGEHVRRAHRKRRSEVEAYDGGVLDDEHGGEHARRAHRRRQSQVDRADTEGRARDNCGEEPVKRGRGKRQSQVEANNAERCGHDNFGEESGRRGRGKRQSQVEFGYGEARVHDHAGEQTKSNHRKRQSQLPADHGEGLDREYLGEQARKVQGKRRSEAGADYRDGGEGQGGRDDLAAGANGPQEGKGAGKAKASRKHKKGGDEETNNLRTEAAKPAGLGATMAESDHLRNANSEQLSHPQSSFPVPFGPKDRKMDDFGVHARDVSTGSEVGFAEHRPSKGREDEHQPFRNNIYIPYRKGFGSDAVEFEKIITWFNMIWDSWRFLLLRTVMVKTSNVFIFLVMIFKDYLYSMWHFCVRYDERCILTSLELRSISTPKNRRIVRLLEWFQALVVRPFLMPKCLATTTWRSQLLFGLNAQKAQSRMRGIAVIRHSKRKDFGLRTLSNISDNAPLDAPNEPTPQKAVRGCGMLLKTFFKDLGHDIVAHFRVEMKLATASFWDRKQTKTRPHLFKRISSSMHEETKAECEIYYNYASELVVVRNVPVTVYRRRSRTSGTFSSRSRSTSGSEHKRNRTAADEEKHSGSIAFRDIFRRQEDSAFRKVHGAWISQVVEELQSLVFNRTWPRLLQKLMSSLSLVASDVFAEHTKVGLLPAYRSVRAICSEEPWQYAPRLRSFCTESSSTHHDKRNTYHTM